MSNVDMAEFRSCWGGAICDNGCGLALGLLLHVLKPDLSDADKRSHDVLCRVYRQTAGYLRTFEKNNKLPNNEMIGGGIGRPQITQARARRCSVFVGTEMVDSGVGGP